MIFLTSWQYKLIIMKRELNYADNLKASGDLPQGS